MSDQLPDQQLSIEQAMRLAVDTASLATAVSSAWQSGEDFVVVSPQWLEQPLLAARAVLISGQLLGDGRAVLVELLAHHTVHGMTLHAADHAAARAACDDESVPVSFLIRLDSESYDAEHLAESAKYGLASDAVRRAQAQLAGDRMAASVIVVVS